MSYLEYFVTELKQKAEALEKDLATVLKDTHGINLEDGLPLEFGLTRAVTIAKQLRAKLSRKNIVLYDLWQRFMRFQEALEIVKNSLTALGDKTLNDESIRKKLGLLEIVVINICQTINNKYLLQSGVQVEEKSFDDLAQYLMKTTLSYIKADKENMKDLVDSGKEEMLAVDIRNYVIVSEILDMVMILQIGISKVIGHGDSNRVESTA